MHSTLATPDKILPANSSLTLQELFAIQQKNEGLTAFTVNGTISCGIPEKETVPQRIGRFFGNKIDLIIGERPIPPLWKGLIYQAGRQIHDVLSTEYDGNTTYESKGLGHIPFLTRGCQLNQGDEVSALITVQETTHNTSPSDLTVFTLGIVGQACENCTLGHNGSGKCLLNTRYIELTTPGR